MLPHSPHFRGPSEGRNSRSDPPPPKNLRPLPVPLWSTRNLSAPSSIPSRPSHALTSAATPPRQYPLIRPSAHPTFRQPGHQLHHNSAKPRRHPPQIRPIRRQSATLAFSPPPLAPIGLQPLSGPVSHPPSGSIRQSASANPPRRPLPSTTAADPARSPA